MKGFSAFVFYVLFLFACFNASAQTTYKNIVLEGGGVRGFAYIGAYEVLDSMGILKTIERVGGSSAGAIQAALLAVGYTPQEMRIIAADIPLKKFNDGGWSVIGGSRRLRKQFGWYKGHSFSEWIGNLIEAKTGNAGITFAELHAQKAAKGYKDLYVTGTDLTYQCLQVFSYESYPQMSVRDAVRISMSIPLYYKPVLIDNAGAVYEKPVKNKRLHVMVDGGVLANYPVQLFDSTKYQPIHDSVNRFSENPETLGIMLERTAQIEHNTRYRGVAPMDITTMNQFSAALYFTLVDKPNPEMTDICLYRRTITIDNLNLSPRVRRLDPVIIDALINSGKKGAFVFFSAAP